MSKLKEAQQKLKNQREAGSHRSSKVNLHVSTGSNKIGNVANLNKPASSSHAKVTVRDDLEPFDLPRSP